MNIRKKILLITDRIPSDSSMPGAPRILELCRVLKKNYDLYIFLVVDENEANTSFKLEDTFSGIHVEYFDDTINGISKIYRLLTPTASFDYRFTHKNQIQALRGKIKGFYELHNIDYIFIDRLRASQFVPNELKKKSILDFCDCLTKLHFRYFKKANSLREKLSNLIACIGLFFWERSEAKKVNYSCLVSIDDLGVFRFLASNQSIPKIVPLGISTNYFISKKPLAKSPKIIFFGTLDYEPNYDACIWLISEIYPHLKKKIPDIKLEIVGANANNNLIKLCENNDIFLSSNVDDIRPYIENNTIFICPLRIGAGVKNKILVAMAMERPVVSSLIALEGLDEKTKSHILVANSAIEFENKIINLLNIINNESSYEVLSNKLKSIRSEIHNKYSWNECAKPLNDLFEKIS